MAGRTLVAVVLALLMVTWSAPIAPAQEGDDGGPGEPSGHDVDLGPLVFAPIAMFGALAVFWVVWLLWFALIMAISLGSVLASVLAIWDCAHRDFPEPNALGTWCVLILMTHWIGAIIYYFVVYRPDTPPKVAVAGG